MNAQQLKNAILQEAIEGRLVPQDPNDEPASVLLNRIREEKKRLVKEGKLKKKDLEVKPISDEDIPFEIPKSWEWVRVKDVFIINPKVIADDDADAAFIPMEKIVACYGSKYSYEIRKWKDVKSSFTSFADGDVAFAKITPCFQNRKSMILENLPNGIGAGTTELKVLRQYSETMNRKYLLYFLASSYFVDEAVFKGTANQQRIIVGYLENKLFPLPPLAEQHRIVAKIEELLPKVEEYGKAQDALNKLNAELPERLKKSILQEAIEGRLVPQDPNDEPASVLLNRIREEKQQLVKEGKLKKKDLIEIPITEDEIPFDIPESWEWVNLFDCVDILYGYPFDSTAFNENRMGFPLIRIRDIIPSSTKTYTTEKTEDRYVIKKGDMLVGMDGNFNVCFWQSDDAYLNQRVCKLTAIESILNQKYLYYYLPYELEEIFKTVSYVTVKHLSDKHFRTMRIPLPPLAEQHRIVEKLEQVLGEIDKLKK